jgi:predicted metal-binding membrane protein
MPRLIILEPTTQRTFLGIWTLLFAVSVAATVAWTVSMPFMSGMPMPGGWTMSMAWLRMPGQTWPGAAATFVAMWTVMMVAMMLPTLAPLLWHYRQAGFPLRAAPHPQRLTAVVALGYFFVWTAVGLAIFPLGAAVADATMHLPGLARAVPIATGAVVFIAGALQFTAWKKRRLACCRATLQHAQALLQPGTQAMPRFSTYLTADTGAAWRYGVRIGLHCCYCCANLMATLLVAGVMDLRVMAAVTVAISAERLAPAGTGGREPAARIVGAVAIAAGLFLIVQAAAFPSTHMAWCG